MSSLENSGLQSTFSSTESGLEVRSFPQSRALEVDVESKGLLASFLLEGKAHHQIDEVSFDQTPGTLLIRHGVERHHLAAEGKLFLIAVDPERTLLNLDCLELLGAHRELFPSIGLQYAKAWLDIVRIEDPTYLKTSLHRFLKEKLRIKPPFFLKSSERDILGEICRSSLAGGRDGLGRENTPRWVLDILEMIESNFSTELSMKVFSEMVGMSEGHLSRSFKVHTGWKVIDRLIERRLQNVKERLIWSDEAIQSLAREAGFRESPHFHRLFKRRVGCTAKVYRERSKMIRDMN